METNYRPKRSRAITTFVLFILLGVTTVIASNAPARKFFFDSFAGQQVPLTVSPDKKVSVTFGSASYSVTTGTTFAIPVLIDTGTLKSTGIAAEITYDRSAIQITSITQGSFYAESLSPTISTNGIIKFTYTAPPATKGKSGSGTVATISVRLLKAGTYNLAFTTNSIVTSIEKNTNAIGELNATQIVGSGETVPPILPSTHLQNVYTTFSRLKYDRYVTLSALKKGDTMYLKNFDASKLRLLQIFLYDYAKKGNQGFSRRDVNSTTFVLKVTSDLPINKQYSYVAKFQDISTGEIATKYFTFWTGDPSMPDVLTW